MAEPVPPGLAGGHPPLGLPRPREWQVPPVLVCSTANEEAPFFSSIEKAEILSVSFACVPTCPQQPLACFRCAENV